jgi:hypothetical protein
MLPMPSSLNSSHCTVMHRRGTVGSSLLYHQSCMHDAVSIGPPHRRRRALIDPSLAVLYHTTCMVALAQRRPNQPTTFTPIRPASRLLSSLLYKHPAPSSPVSQSTSKYLASLHWSIDLSIREQCGVGDDGEARLGGGARGAGRGGLARRARRTRRRGAHLGE